MHPNYVASSQPATITSRGTLENGVFRVRYKSSRHVMEPAYEKWLILTHSYVLSVWQTVRDVFTLDCHRNDEEYTALCVFHTRTVQQALPTAETYKKIPVNCKLFCLTCLSLIYSLLFIPKGLLWVSARYKCLMHSPHALTHGLTRCRGQGE